MNIHRNIINDLEIVPMKLTNQDKKKPKHHEFFGDNKYPNVVVFAKKHSGKTNMLYNLVHNHKILDKDTKVFIFSSSCKKDQCYIDMIDHLKSKGNKVEKYTSIYETKAKGKRNITTNKLKEILNGLQKENKKNKKKKKKDFQEDKDEDMRELIREVRKKKSPAMKFLFSNMVGKKPNDNSDDDEDDFVPDEPRYKNKKKKQNKKFLTPKYLFIFDDLGKELRDPEIGKLMKTNRHYLATCFYIGHSPLDLNKDARTQCDVLITFQGFQPTYVEHMRLFCNSPCEEDQFYNIYKEATNEKYNFLWVSDNKFRQNFNTELII